MIRWFKKLFGIVSSYDRDIDTFHRTLRRLEKIVADRTNINVDLHMKSPSQIIMVGRIGNRDYIQVYSLPDEDFKTLVDHLRELRRYGHVERIDAPFDMHAVVKSELRR